MEYKNEKIIFLSDGIKLVGNLYYPSSRQRPPGLLFLYGAGKKNKNNIYAPWQQYLAENGFSSLAFYTRGMVESEGHFEDSSLNNRLIDASNALEVFINSGHVDPARIGVLGNSMGGHVAARLVDKFTILKVVILLAAAAYSAEAEDKKLNESFTKAITKENSWKSSPAFQFLKDFKGQILVIYPEKDVAIPDGVKAGYKSVIKAPELYIIIPEIDHNILLRRNELEEKANRDMYLLTVNFLKRYL